MAAFGWSVGDLVSALSVVLKVHEALKDAGGAADSYQESVSFLESLSLTLSMLVSFYEANLCKDDRAGVKSQIELIKSPIDAFTKRVKDKFESGLGIRPETGFRAKLKGHSRKVQWALWTDTECRKLSSKISAPLAAVQMSISLHTITVVSAIPGHVSTDIERMITSTIPTLLEKSMLPLKDRAFETYLDQIAHSTTIERSLASLSEALASRIGTAFERIREGDVQRSRKSEENCYALMGRIERMEGRLMQGLEAVPSHIFGDASTPKHQLIGSLADESRMLPPLASMDRARTQKYPFTDIPQPSKQSQPFHMLLHDINNIMENNPSENGLEHAHQVDFPTNIEFEASTRALNQPNFIQPNYQNEAVLRVPQGAWIEAGQHFQLFIRLLLRGFYDFFIQLWPLFTSLFLQLRVMQKCIIRFPSILSKDDITFIDALGRSRKLPYTVYGNWETFNRFLRTHYEKVPGETHVLENSYHITRQDGNIISDHQWQEEAVPNATISMAVSLNIGISGSRCPKCHSEISQNGRNLVQKSHLFVCPNSKCLLEFFFHHSSNRQRQPQFPVWLEVAGSIKRVQYSNMRRKVDTLTLSDGSIKHPYLSSDGPEPYQHLVRAENIERHAKDSDFKQNYTKILASRKKERADLEHYFKRVYIFANSWHPCRLCGFMDYKYPDDVERHMLLHHSRIYGCIFDFAGCEEAFADKAQWKCHINSQHLNWVCDVEECPNEKIHPMNHYHRDFFFFDRKQKVVRLQMMRDRALELLRVSMRERKEPPLKLCCSLETCSETFEGLGCWTSMIEHVAKHVKDDAVVIAEWYCGKLQIHYDRDELFLDWALSSGIVKRDGRGYKLKRLS